MVAGKRFPQKDEGFEIVMGKLQGKSILVVGLGNPGHQYATHRHNLGFMVVDALSDTYGGSWAPASEKARLCKIEIESRDVLLVKPQTFMNLSGKAVEAILRRSRANPSEMVVIHDDMDLPLGRLRIKVGGGDGGHRGVKSIADSLRFRDFIRLRLGIGRPPEGHSPENFVLSPFFPEERETVRDIVFEATQAISVIVVQGVTMAQNVFHSAKKENHDRPRKPIGSSV